MQFSSLFAIFTAIAATGVLAHPSGQCKPPTHPTDPKPTCDGNKVCCTQGVQGDVGYYCWENVLAEGQTCGNIHTVCCKKDATKDLTPRGYTWSGCHAMAEPKPDPKPTCDGIQVCCTQGVQGDVGYYCWDNALAEGQTCSAETKTVCCKKDATKDLTPKGYTWSGCHM